MKITKEVVGILGYGEIGKAIALICKRAGYKVLIRELTYDQIKDNQIDYLHINIPEHDNPSFVKTAIANIKELKPRLTIIHSSITPGTTRKIFYQTKLPIVHSPIIGIHPNLYNSIKYYFKKIIGPIDRISAKEAKKHFLKLGLSSVVFKNPETTEIAKLLDLIYYAWNIIFCKWVAEVCNKNKLDFDEVYIQYNQIYNQGFQNLWPNVIRPILTPIKGPIGGHCVIPATILFNKYQKNRFTKFILQENRQFLKENYDATIERKKLMKIRRKFIKRQDQK